MKVRGHFPVMYKYAIVFCVFLMIGNNVNRVNDTQSTIIENTTYKVFCVCTFHSGNTQTDFAISRSHIYCNIIPLILYVALSSILFIKMLPPNYNYIYNDSTIGNILHLKMYCCVEAYTIRENALNAYIEILI